jgi:hypothetical protein
MVAAQKVSAATVQRIWNKHKLQPHRVESFKFNSDPQFAPKVRDIVGLYMNPPDKAIVLSVDEKIADDRRADIHLCLSRRRERRSAALQCQSTT